MARFRNSFYHCFLVMGSLFDTCASLSELLYSSHVMTQSVESCTTFPSKEQEALCGGGGKRILLPLLGCFVYKAIVLSGLEHNDLNTCCQASAALKSCFSPAVLKSLQYEYIKHMNNSDKRQSNILLGELIYALLNSSIGWPTDPSGYFAAVRYRDMTSSLISSQKVLPASLQR